MIIIGNRVKVFKSSNKLSPLQINFCNPSEFFPQLLAVQSTLVKNISDLQSGPEKITKI